MGAKKCIQANAKTGIESLVFYNSVNSMQLPQVLNQRNVGAFFIVISLYSCWKIAIKVHPLKNF